MVKEVVMDVPLEGGGGGGRRRRRTGRRRVAAAAAPDEVHQDGGGEVAVEKTDGGAPAVVPETRVVGGARPVVHRKPVAPAPAPAPVAPQKVVIAPPKKKPAKLLLVPKTRTQIRAHPPKTFKAHRVSVVIDNTAKTAKRRRMTLQRVEAMTEEQLREAAVGARLSRLETVAKVPADLLRQMLKDYYTMRGKFL